MAVYTSPAALASALQSQIGTGNPALTTTPQQAFTKAQKWIAMAENMLETYMNENYKPGGSKYRTGAYPHMHTHIGPTLQGNTVTGKVTYTPYSRMSLFGTGSVDIPTLFEKGYRVRKNVWFKSMPYFGWRTPGNTMWKVVQALGPSAAADGVKLTLI